MRIDTQCVHVHVIVVGGGFAGVAAAARLRAHGARVTVLEARDTLGGRARSDVVDGITIDTGAQLVTSAFTHTLHLLRGAVATPGHAQPDARSPSLRATGGRDIMLLGGARVPLHFGSLTSLLTYRGLTTRDKLRLARSLLPLLARERAHLSAANDAVSPMLDATTARGYMTDRVSASAADQLVEPPLNPFYAVRGDEASLAFYLALARYGSDGDVLAPTAGWSALLDHTLLADTLPDHARVEDALAERAPPRGSAVAVVTQARAERLALDARAVTVYADTGSWTGDAAILATGPVTAAALLAPHGAADDALIAWLRSVPLRRTWTLALVVDRELPRDAFGIFHPPSASEVVSACAVHGAKVGDAAPIGRDVLLAWPTPALALRMHNAPAAEIADVMTPAVEAMVPEVRGHVTRARVYRTDEGTPTAVPGSAADRTRGRALAAAIPWPVRLAGDYLAVPFIEGAVVSGERAADAVRTLAADGA